MNFQISKLVLVKAGEPEIKLPTSAHFSSVQSLSHVRVFMTLRIAARQASLSITNYQSSLKLTSIESVMPSSHLNLLDHQKSKRVPESISVLLTMPKPLTVWITINCGKFWKRWEYQTTWHAPWETYMQGRKQQLKLDMDQQTGSK